jgi:ferric-dicitrate binding protein FerR (iron transport regulator)
MKKKMIETRDGIEAMPDATTETNGGMSEALLFRFFWGQTTDEETDRITAWLEKDPVAHQKILNETQDLWALSVMSDTSTRTTRWDYYAFRFRRFSRLKNVRYAAVAAAASLIVALGASQLFFSQRISRMAELATTIEAPAGQHIRFTLNDGSVIDLNSGGRISYPAVFTGGERRVELSGEAMFDVAPNAKKPFIVETFACEVEVLGTRFNVIADEDKQEFSTALFEGSVAVRHAANNEKVILEPDMIVRLSGDRLVAANIGGMDDYLWPDGIISLGGLPFDRLVEKLEKAYNVRIVVERPTLPAVKYTKLKVRVSDGIDHAMKILQLASDFTYVYDTSENTITIE